MSDAFLPNLHFTPHMLDRLSPPLNVEEIAACAWQQPHSDLTRIQRYVAQAVQAHEVMGGFTHMVVIGTGGSTLGAKMLRAFGSNPACLLFAETVDAHSVKAILSEVELASTLFLVISKSGSTIETMTLYNLFAQHYDMAELPKHFMCITDPQPSPLRAVAEQFGLPVLDHPADIGGRFSVFTIVALLPALFAGVDINAVIRGASAYQAIPVAEAMWPHTTAWHLAHYLQGRHITVMLPYLDRLSQYTYWWRQLWAESLGKGGYFTTPFTSIGSVDQHSQLQLWLDGKGDKSFTLISMEEKSSLSVDDRYMPPSIYTYTHGQTTQTIQHALVQGTIHSLRQAELPLCHMHFKHIGAAELGVLIMHGLTEIMALANYLSIDPYGQPAVEVGKSKAKELLMSNIG